MFTVQVVVPEQGLVRLTQRLLGGLGLDDVGVSTFDHWVEDQGRHMLKGLPKRIYGWTPSAVVLSNPSRRRKEASQYFR